MIIEAILYSSSWLLAFPTDWFSHQGCTEKTVWLGQQNLSWKRKMWQLVNDYIIEMFWESETVWGI